MSRGHGKLQRAILDHFALNPDARLTGRQIGEAIYGTEPTPAQDVAIRRACRALVREGRLTYTDRDYARTANSDDAVGLDGLHHRAVVFCTAERGRTDLAVAVAVLTVREEVAGLKAEFARMRADAAEADMRAAE